MTFGPAEKISDGGDATDVFESFWEQSKMQQFNMVDDLAANFLGYLGILQGLSDATSRREVR